MYILVFDGRYMALTDSGFEWTDYIGEAWKPTSRYLIETVQRSHGGEIKELAIK